MSSISFKLEDIFSVARKVVIVTGGGTGIGKAITAGFATNGAKVYITGRRLGVLESAAKELNVGADKGGEVFCVQGDVASKAGVVKIVEQIKAKEQVVDVLINCAGVSKSWKTPVKDHNDPDAIEKFMWEGVEDDDFNYSNSININGVYFMTSALIPLLRQSDNPSVVVIASIAGIALQRTMGTPTYAASKAGTIHLGALLASRLHPLKIRVNTICPGIFPSEMTGTSGSAGSGHDYNLGVNAEKAALRSTMQRPGKPDEIVAPVLMLCSKGGMYMNNAVLTVDGGRLMVAGANDGIRMPEETFP